MKLLNMLFYVYGISLEKKSWNSDFILMRNEVRVNQIFLRKNDNIKMYTTRQLHKPSQAIHISFSEPHWIYWALMLFLGKFVGNGINGMLGRIPVSFSTEVEVILRNSSKFR